MIIDNIEITLEKYGAREYTKVSYPLRYGRFSEIKTPEYVFQFNLNGEIKFIEGRTATWPDHSEWLKRTCTNDWVYYSTGGYSGVFDAFGEYYLPCLSYPSNMVNSIDPFDDNTVLSAIDSWNRLHDKIKGIYTGDMPDGIKQFLGMVKGKSPRRLMKQAGRLHEIIGDNITVLPPDTRHVDYDIIPVIIADGCLHRCAFCMVKTGRGFSCRPRGDIIRQVGLLKRYYGPDIRNYNSIFLGQHDALNSGIDQIEFAALSAHEEFELDRSHLRGANLFLFGSVNSILNSDDSLFDRLNKLPFSTYINVGLESADRETLSMLKKPVTPDMVERAFFKILETNRRLERIEITSNFVFGRGLPEGHLPSVLRLMEKAAAGFFHKGAIYFSPLLDTGNYEKRAIKRDFYGLKTSIPLPAYLYLIQRL